MTSFTIDITPEGMKTLEGRRRIESAMDKRNQVDFRAYEMLSRLNDERCLGHEALRHTLDYFGDENASQTASDLIEEIEAIFRDRRQAERELLAAVAGRPA